MTLYMQKQMRVLKSSNLGSFKETYIKISLFRKDFLLSSNSSKKQKKPNSILGLLGNSFVPFLEESSA